MERFPFRAPSKRVMMKTFSTGGRIRVSQDEVIRAVEQGNDCAASADSNIVQLGRVLFELLGYLEIRVKPAEPELANWCSGLKEKTVDRLVSKMVGAIRSSQVDPAAHVPKSVDPLCLANHMERLAIELRRCAKDWVRDATTVTARAERLGVSSAPPDSEAESGCELPNLRRRLIGVVHGIQDRIQRHHSGIAGCAEGFDNLTDLIQLKERAEELPYRPGYESLMRGVAYEASSFLRIQDYLCFSKPPQAEA